MKIGIFTQPLKNNYGGILQNYALQQVLIGLGHEPVTLDYRLKNTFIRYLLSLAKTLLLFFIHGKRRRFVKFRKGEERNPLMAEFVEKNISTTVRLRKITEKIIKGNKLQAVITGSDQVWRPIYNRNLKYSFLSFVKSDKIIKIAYAASFGVDFWEYSKHQTRMCSNLVKSFRAVSVREQSGIALCKNYLKVDAVEVLDPTLLLSKENYESLCRFVPIPNMPFIFVYILDMTDKKKSFYERLASEKNLQVQFINTDEYGNVTVEKWLSKFRDAEYVITDSFHGTVFSIVFHKDFISIVNNNRGADRFVSLLSKFNLQNRLIDEQHLEFYANTSIEWNQVETLHNSAKVKSLEFLRFNISQ